MSLPEPVQKIVNEILESSIYEGERAEKMIAYVKANPWMINELILGGFTKGAIVFFLRSRTR